MENTHELRVRKHTRKLITVFAASGLLAVSVSIGITSASASPSAAAKAVAKALIVEKKFTVVPKTIPQTISLNSAPPTGDSVIYFVAEDNPSDLDIGLGVQAAAKAAGWTSSFVDYDASNPATLTAAFATALAEKPTVVAINGDTPSEFGGSVVSEYAAAGIPIILSDTGPTPLSKYILGDPDGPAKDILDADALASWFVVNSKGKGEALVAHVLGFTALDLFVKTFQSEVRTLCKLCVVKVQDVSLNDWVSGDEPADVVTALRNDPKLKYLFYDDGNFATGVDAALKTAGLLGHITIGGRDLLPSDAADLRNGTESVWIGLNLLETGYGDMDLAFRYVENMQISQSDYAASNAPISELLTKANIGHANSFTAPSNSLQLYEKLWKVPTT